MFNNWGINQLQHVHVRNSKKSLKYLQRIQNTEKERSTNSTGSVVAVTYMTHACNMNEGDMSQDPRPPPRITCQWTVAPLPDAGPAVIWGMRLGPCLSPDTLHLHSMLPVFTGMQARECPAHIGWAAHPREHRWPQPMCWQLPAAPTSSNHRKESKSQFSFMSKGSREQWSSLNLSSTVWAERTAHSRWVKVECPRLYYLPSVSSCSGTRQQKQREQHSVNYVGDLSARSLSPLSWASFSKSTRISEQSSHPAPETRRCPPVLVTRAPRLATHWRLSSNGMLVLPLCYFLFYIYKKIYKQRYQLAAVDIIITTCKWRHLPRAQEVIPVNIHTPSCLCARYLEIPATLSQQTCGIHEQVSSFWYILPYLSDGRSSLLQLD